jgi:hypothetical protein
MALAQVIIDNNAQMYMRCVKHPAAGGQSRKDRSANGTSGSVGRAARTMRSNRRS